MTVRRVAQNPPLNIPIPDPSLITTEQITLAKTELRAEFTMRDQALAALVNEKFDAFGKQLDERRGRYQANDTALRAMIALESESNQHAVKAAFESQKELTAANNAATSAAINKSEAGTTKQIDGIHALIASMSKSVDDKFASISARLDRGDGALAQQRGSQTTFLAVASVIVGIAGVGVACVVAIGHPAATPASITEAATTERNRIAGQLEAVMRQLDTLATRPSSQKN